MVSIVSMFPVETEIALEQKILVSRLLSRESTVFRQYFTVPKQSKF